MYVIKDISSVYYSIGFFPTSISPTALFILLLFFFILF